MNKSDLMLAESMVFISMLGRGIGKSRSNSRSEELSIKKRHIYERCVSLCNGMQDSPQTRGYKRKKYAQYYAERDYKLKKLIKLEGE